MLKSFIVGTRIPVHLASVLATGISATALARPIKINFSEPEAAIIARAMGLEDGGFVTRAQFSLPNEIVLRAETKGSRGSARHEASIELAKSQLVIDRSNATTLYSELKGLPETRRGQASPSAGYPPTTMRELIVGKLTLRCYKAVGWNPNICHIQISK